MELPASPWSHENWQSPAGGDTLGISALVNSLSQQRVEREIQYWLRKGIKEASAPFSYLRTKGLSVIARTVTLVSQAPEIIHHFEASQGVRELQVVPILFEHSLNPRPPLVPPESVDPVGCDPPLRPTTPPSDEETAAALRVLGGVCLLDANSRALAGRHQAIKHLVDRLLVSSPAVRTASLDALLAVLVDSPVNQKELFRLKGMDRVLEILKNRNAPELVRLKCVEFLVLLLGQILPKSAPADDRGAPSAAVSQMDVDRALPPMAAALITKNAFSTLTDNPTPARLHELAKRVLDTI